MSNQELNMPIETRFNCRFCGDSIVQIGRKKGRPRQYCSDDCRNAVKYLEQFYKIAEKTTFTDSARRALRGDLMTFMNQSLPHPVKSKIGTEITEESFSETLNQISGLLKSSL